jgi:GNAT superfamily N-acetyltransferase
MGDPDLITIRRAGIEDWPAILALVPRLVEFGPPPWRDSQAMSVTDRKVIGAALQSVSEDPVVMVAVANVDSIVGFLHLHSITDYYSAVKNGHVADIVVAQALQGRGVGRQLLDWAEQWARRQGYGWLSISVFPQNVRALKTYERRGFKPDMARLIKPLP